MYSSGYSQVSKSSPLAQKKMQYRSKGKSCGYYMRIVFFFSSLIQSLIIVSLVLFLVYGKTQDSASTSRIQDLEESFSRLSIENVALRQQRKNLTNLLNTTLTEKARNDWDLAKLIYVSNISAIIIQDIDKQLQQCNTKMFLCQTSGNFAVQCPVQPYEGKQCNCGLLCERLKARVDLVESNFTQTTQRMRMELDQTTKERDSINLEVIHLRRDKFTHEKEVEFFRQKCKEDFSQSLSGISNVSKALLEKIASLFPSHIAFQLTCPKQREHLEQIRTNCTSLSLEVEDRLQHYLDKVGSQVVNIEGENSRLKAENLRLSEDYRSCSMNRTGLMLQHRQNVDKLQQKHDEEKEKLLVDKLRLIGEKEVLVNEVKYKSKAIDHLTEQTKQLNMSCMLKAGGFPGGSRSLQPQPSWNIFGGGSSSASSSSSGSQLGRAGSGGLGSSFGSFGSPFNKPGSTGTGSSTSSLSSSGLGSSTGLGYNKPGSTGIGSSSSSSGSGSSTGLGYNKPGSTGIGSSSSSSGSGSSTGLGYNKPGSTGIGSSSSSSGSGSSTGLGYNKPGSTGAGSSSSSSSSVGSGLNKPASSGGIFSSTGSSSGTGINKPVLNGRSSSTLGSSSATSGIGSNKPTSSVKSTSGIGSSSGSTGSTGSTSKSGSSSSFSWLGFGGSSSGQSKTGTGTGKGPSTGNSGGTGSLFGGGRTSGLGGGSTLNVAQHLKDLQRIINPPGPEEKQDLARILG